MSADFLAGLVGGAAGVVCGHPADTVKVVQQAGKRARISDVFLRLFRTEGLKGFFKGLQYPVISAGAINSIFFGVYGASLRHLCPDSAAGSASLTSVYLAGLAGGTVQLAVACPVELVKTRLQTTAIGTARPWDCVRHTVASQGLRGLYTGLGPHFWRDGHGFGVYMVLYEGLLELWGGGRARASSAAQFWAGGLAGTLCWLSVLPFDVVKSRLQAQDPELPRRYRSALHCFASSYRAEGAAVFFRGATAMSLRAFPVNGVTFFVYEAVLEQCGRYEKD